MIEYDAIVIGARVAGSSTALLLARKGHRVLLVDRATFPSDTMSTHLIHPPGMSMLHKWGLSDDVIATGCPPVPVYSLDFGPIVLTGEPRGLPGARHAYAPRRIVLDHILVEAAAEAGAEVRQDFTVESLVVENGTVRGIRGHSKQGANIAERARIVVGADGVNSLVARSVGAEKYNEVPAYEALYYSYWSGLPTNAFEIYVRGDRAISALPTNDELTVVLVAWPTEQFETNKRDVEGNYMGALEREPVIAERMRESTRESRIVGAHMHNFYRQSHGPGWALVGDAGYYKDACTAQGITDAFRSAELLAEALDDLLSGGRNPEEALSAYQNTRDRTTLPMYELTCQLASFDPPPPEMNELLGALYGNPEATQDFLSILAGTMPVQEFFDPSNVERYLSAANGGDIPETRREQKGATA